MEPVSIVSIGSGPSGIGPASLPPLTAWLLPCGLFLCLMLTCFWFARAEQQPESRAGRQAWGMLLAVAGYAAIMFAWMLRDMHCLIVGAAQGCQPWLNWMAIDEPILRWLFAALAQRNPEIWAKLTWLGGVEWLSVVTALGVLWALYRRAWLQAMSWLYVGVGIALWIALIKGWVERPRPAISLITETGWSFPSGHSAGSAAIYGLLAWLVSSYLLRRGHRWAAALCWWLALGLAAMIGISRVVLSVHFASDVMAGWLLGTAWLGCVVAISLWAKKHAAERALKS